MVLLPRGVQERVVAQVKGQGEARTPDWEDVDVPERIARAFHMLHKVGPIPQALHPCCRSGGQPTPLTAGDVSADLWPRTGVWISGKPGIRSGRGPLWVWLLSSPSLATTGLFS